MLPTAFRDRVAITRGAEVGGHRDPTTGLWVPGDEDTVIYEGPANVQAGGLLNASRRSTSTVFAEADGVVALPPRAASRLLDVVPDDRVHITYASLRRGNQIDQRGADAVARFVRPEDRAILVNYV